MATIDQLNANRENATHSTGPTTEAGKATCGQNSLKHGLASSRVIIPGESQEEYDEALALLIAEHQPATHTETLLIEDLAKHRWLAQRSIELQNMELVNGLTTKGEIPKSLGVLIRYQTTNERAAHKDLTTFLTLRAARLAALAAEIGSASQNAAQAFAEADAAAEKEVTAKYAAWQEAFIRYSMPPTAEDLNANDVNHNDLNATSSAA